MYPFSYLLGIPLGSPTSSILPRQVFRASRCFHDCQSTPFRLQDHLPQLQSALLPVGPDNLVHQPGLVNSDLPDPEIQVDHLADDNACSIPTDPTVPSRALFSCLGETKQLRFAPEPMDPGYNLDNDLQQYSNDLHLKRSCNILGEWLPLAPVNIEKDEGLVFPSTSSRWQLLALRELERETIPGAEEVIRLLEEENLLNQKNQVKWRQELFSSPHVPRRLAERLSLPLSPASDLDDPFIPRPEVLMIDLTSEPSSPVGQSVEKLQTQVQNGSLDSEPAVPSTISGSPPSPRTVLLDTTAWKASQLKLDVPLMTSSPEDPQEYDLHGDSLFGDVNHKELFQNQEESGGVFDEAMLAVLDGYRDQADRMVENERLNPADSALRMQIPALDFRIPEPEWAGHVSTSRAQLSWLQENLLSAFQFPHPLRLVRQEASLKWTPIPPGSGRISLKESSVQLGPASKKLLTLSSSQMCSGDYITKPPGLRILQLPEDEEMEPEASSPEESHTPVLQETSHDIRQPEKPTATRGVPSLDELLKSSRRPGRKSLRRKFGDDSTGLLLDSNDPSATSQLLSAFIELRHPKKPKIANNSTQPSGPARPLPQPPPSDPLSSQGTEEAARHSMVEAPVPQLNLPMEKCRYIISMNFNRVVFTHLEKAWPQAELVDRDFSQYNTVVWSPGSAQPKEVASPLAFEVDISLSPSAGLIATTMLKAKQRPLPGTNTLTPLRERVRQVSRKYESLFILVSENNPMGEYVGSPSASDIASYTDFVRFTASLQSDITTYLVSGAEVTLSKWILTLMCRYAPRANQFGHFLEHRDTSWQLLLRRAGLNITAAQVISGLLLAEYGNLGLAHFLAMTIEERLSRFGRIMGGETALRNASRVLERPWV
ncbi:hypothetical protein ACJZ2D_006097 [Fusarium nematophilum]